MYANLLDPMLQLYADQILASDAVLAAYGLDKTELTLTLTIAGKTHRAVFRRTDNGQCQMARPDGTMVYQFGEEPLLLLLQDYTALVGGSIVTYAVGDLQDVTLTRDGVSLFIAFSGSGDSLTVRVGDKELDQSARGVLYYFKSLMPYSSRAVLFYDEERSRRRSGATSRLRDEVRGQKRREIVALRF